MAAALKTDQEAPLSSRKKILPFRCVINRDSVWRHIYFLALVVVLFLGSYLRLTYTDLHRLPVHGDEYTYHNAAKSILDYGYMVREPYLDNGDLSRSQPVSALSPGYPVFLVFIYSLLGDSFVNVIAVQIALSIFSLFLIFVILKHLKVRRLAVVLSLLLAAVYPGFLYNNDRLLTEQLFVFVMLGFVAAFIKALSTGLARYVFLAALIVAYAIHVRAQALPFALLAIVFFMVYGQGPAKQRISQSVLFFAVIVVVMSPYWIHNYLVFGQVILLPESGTGPMIWGAVPYFLDMGATVGRSLTDVVAANSTPAPLAYWNWRVFGYAQQMWGDVWDERLVHAQLTLQPWLLLQHLLVIPTVALMPFLARKPDPRVLFVAAIPLAITYMNAPFHGLPRYAFPAIPFVFIVFAVLLSYAIDKYSLFTHSTRLDLIKPKFVVCDRIIRFGFLVASALFSVVVLWSTYVFAWNIHKEMSTYRLARYMGVSPSQAIAAREVGSYKFDAEVLPVANATKIIEGVYVNDLNAPAVINVSVPQTAIAGGERIVSKVVLNMSGGFYYDFMTVYWKSPKIKEFSESHVYVRFPVNFLEKKQVIYVDEDVTELLIVPRGFRGGEIHVQSIDIKKYNMNK
ncbi:glycosyltransferase family 39 protein [Pseudomonas shahriarae]|uniref:Glycosyltransferase family 39 protein n=1 Tax=Pseudomonas shahriarae TaxID=2745512 RepID=A0A9X4C4D3_9PSED|nr:glycosyltransferase family 39 protein [Pseudomonas shahriarae]MDD1009927.1 glycosyltransferase family 39 protein [Pseudomonas shahriarae]